MGRAPCLEEARNQLLRRIVAEARSRSGADPLAADRSRYQADPEAFAREVLGSVWWERQREVARELAAGRRVAVKSANGVGKTYLAADLVLWFLYTWKPSIVLTTAPTWRQVRQVLWEEIGRRVRHARIALPGRLMAVRLRLGEGWFAVGLATTDAVRFQGYHAENLLIVLDEASGVPDAIWEAAEGVAVGANNRMLAIGNPLRASGRFYEVFQREAGWRTLSISALEHPNVRGDGPAIPGAVTLDAVDDRVRDWTEPAEEEDAETLVWRGARRRPNNVFRARVLGQFPDSDEDALIPLRWVEAAMARSLPAEGPARMAVDVARFGADRTVIGVRRGARLTRMECVRGKDVMEVAGLAARVALEEGAESIAVDAIGIGAGVADRLTELGLAGVDAVNVSMPAHSTERYANRRAELYWELRERFRRGEISLPEDAEVRRELTALRWGLTSRGQIRVESKDAMRRRGLPSPDAADMLALLYDAAAEWSVQPAKAAPSVFARLREEMRGW